MSQFLANDPENYEAQLISTNSISINTQNSLLPKTKFIIANHYFKKKTKKENTFANYHFTVNEIKNHSTSFIDISINSIHEDFLPIKLRKRYSMVMTQIDLEIKALVKVSSAKGTADYYYTTTVGNVTFNLINIGIIQKNDLNQHQKILLPKLTKEGKTIDIQSISISSQISYQNPSGEIDDSWSKFIINNSEAAKSLLESIASP